MKTVILCGGKGTRIQDVAHDVPKPMIPVGGQPIIWHIMQSYAHFGHKDFVLCLGHKGPVIKEFFLNYRMMIGDFSIDFGNGGKVVNHGRTESIDWNVTFADTGEDTMTGSRVERIRKYIGDDDTFMLTYGDGVCDIDIATLVDFHRSHGKIMTVSGVRPPSRFGELDHDDSGRIVEFNEKPQATGGRISGGYFVCDRRLFDYLDPSRADETLEAGPMRKIAADGEMMMYAHDGFWQCMDTRRDYTLLNDLYRSGDAPWKKW